MLLLLEIMQEEVFMKMHIHFLHTIPDKDEYVFFLRALFNYTTLEIFAVLFREHHPSLSRASAWHGTEVLPYDTLNLVQNNQTGCLVILCTFD